MALVSSSYSGPTRSCSPGLRCNFSPTRPAIIGWTLDDRLADVPVFHDLVKLISGQDRIICFDNVYDTVRADVHTALTGSEFFGNLPAWDVWMRPGRAIVRFAALHDFPTMHVFDR